MDAATVARLMSLIPERAAWAHSGTAFAAHDGQGEQVRLLAGFLNWMSPLACLSKDEQRALGLLASHNRPAALEADPDGEEDAELEDAPEAFDEDATLPPLPHAETGERPHLGLHPGLLEDHAQQDVAAGGEVFRPRVLDLVMADAAFAGHEDHGGGRDAGEVHGVVAGAADDVAVTKA
jgi:hypothetical protein